MKRISSWFKKYFIPHNGNGHQPHFLRHESMLFFFFLLMVIELGFLVQVFVVFDKTKFLASVLPGILTTITNEERAENNLAPLKESALLDRAAQMKAEDMARGGYFAHTSPTGLTPWYWFDQVGYSYIYAGENLAVNFFESEDVAKAWMNSPTHRANIVKPTYTEIGIGVAKGVYEGKNTVFVAQLFGTPIQAPQAEPQAFKPEEKETTPVVAAAPITPTKSTAPAIAPTPTTSKVTKTTPPKPAEIPVQKAIPQVTKTPSSTQVLGEESVSNNKIIATLNGMKVFLKKVVSSPRTYSGYAYGGLAALVLFAIFLAVIIRAEMHHPKVLLRGVGMVAVVVFLFVLNLTLLGTETQIPSENTAAAVVAY